MMKDNKKDLWNALKSALLISLGLFIYIPSWSASWVWDDYIEIVSNNEIRGSLDSLLSIWTNPEALDYFPLKSTLQWFEWHLWGLNPLGYHLVSVVLHIISGFLIWRILHKIGMSRAWLGGLLFIVHPIAVESVAWISELKNTLSLPLLLLAFDLFIDYVSDNEGQLSKRRFTYLASVIVFILALLAKSSVVMLPVFLLLYLWWKKSSISKRDVTLTLPFFAASLILGLITIYFQHTRAIAGEVTAVGTLSERIISSILVLVFYLQSFVIPFFVTPIYARWPIGLITFSNILGWTLLIALIAYLVSSKKVYAKHIMLGLGWFSINLIPVLGIIPMSFSKYALVSDHFAYIAIIGLISLTVLGFSRLLDWLKSKHQSLQYSGIILGLCILCALAFTSYMHAKDFDDDISFYSKIINDNPSCWMAHDNLGNIFNESKHYPEAIAEYNEVLKINPHYAKAHYNLGLALVDSGNLTEGISHYEEALRLHSDYAEVHNNLGIALSLQGDVSGAISHFKEALKLKPLYGEAELNWGLVLARDKRIADAIEHFEAAVKLNPESDHAHLVLGYAYQALGRQIDADKEIRIADSLKSRTH